MTTEDYENAGIASAIMAVVSGVLMLALYFDPDIDLNPILIDILTIIYPIGIMGLVLVIRYFNEGMNEEKWNGWLPKYLYYICLFIPIINFILFVVHMVFYAICNGFDFVNRVWKRYVATLDKLQR